MKQSFIIGIVLFYVSSCFADNHGVNDFFSINTIPPDTTFLSKLSFDVPDSKVIYGMNPTGIVKHVFKEKKSIFIIHRVSKYRSLESFYFDKDMNIYVNYHDNMGFRNRIQFNLISRKSKFKQINDKSKKLNDDYYEMDIFNMYPLVNSRSNEQLFFSVYPPLFFSILTIKQDDYNSNKGTWLQMIGMSSLEELINVLDDQTKQKVINYIYYNKNTIEYAYCLKSPTIKHAIEEADDLAEAREIAHKAKVETDAAKAKEKAEIEAAKAKEKAEELAFNQLKSKAVLFYSKEIKEELQKSNFFVPKGEFESISDYQVRQKKAEEFRGEINNKYTYLYKSYSDSIESDRIEKIKNSYSHINLSIAQLGTYNSEKQTFPITFDGFRPMELYIPLQDAKSFKENINAIKVAADKQLKDDAQTYQIFNIEVTHPITGFKYSLFPSKPLYLDYVSNSVKETGIPILEPIVKFIEPSGNNLLDGDEKAILEVTVNNSGSGAARDVRVNLTSTDYTGFVFDKTKSLTGIAPNQSQTVIFEVIADRKISNKEIPFRFNFSEARGFNPADINYIINTQAFKAPSLAIKDVGIKEISGNGNNRIENSETIEVTTILQNTGQGKAENVKAVFDTGDRNILSLSPDKTNIFIGTLNPGEFKLLTFDFVVNNVYNGADLLPLKVVVSESYKEYGGTFPLNLEMRKVQLASKNIKVIGQYDQKIDIKDIPLTADIDKNIPESGIINENRFALIIGNEDYKSYQPDLNSEVNVLFAENDARIFREYAKKTLGVPEANLNYLPNATAGQMNQALAKMNLIAKNSNGKAELIFYYAGHGLPDENTKEPYLIPVDVSGTTVNEGGIKLANVYEKLTQYQSQKVSVFIDACFTGGARDQGLLSARAIKTKPKEMVLAGNIVVFSSSSGDQSSLPYKEKQHGMFTYFLLKMIQDTKGEISMKELSDYVKGQVSLQSVIINNKEQTPEINAGNDTWGNWKLR